MHKNESPLQFDAGFVIMMAKTRPNLQAVFASSAFSRCACLHCSRRLER
jgi:hypothetical protein